MPLPSDLIPHRPPWVVLDRVISVGDGGATAEKATAAGEPWTDLLLVELVAQAAACLAGSESAGARHHGYLVAAQGWKFHRRPAPGERLTIVARRRATMGALSSFRGAVRAGDEELAAGEITCAVQVAEEDGR